MDQANDENYNYKKMKNLRHIYCLIIILSMASGNVLAQKPVVKSIDKSFGSLGETLAISGADFGNNMADIVVFAGGTQATVSFVSDQFIEVQVPAGTTFNRIAVLNTATGLIGYSTAQFSLSFGGQNGISAADFETQVDFFAERGLYDICMCDFNDDGLLDIASANEQDNSISLFTNASTVGAVNFTKSSIFVGSPTINTNCGDLNGDGKPDLVVSEGNNGNQLYVFQNTSTGPTISFSSQNITFSGAVLRRIEINDLDGDGKPELIITNSGSNRVLFLENQSSIASISFSPAIQEIIIPQAARTMGLSVEDINGDQLPEIIVNQFLTDNGNCFIIQNTSTPGNFQFNNITELATPGTIVNLKVGDIDGDGKRDIVATQLLTAAITIFLNQTSVGGNPDFAAPQNFSANLNPWGLDFGDVDGDKKNDIVIGSINTVNQVTILNNNSTPGNLQFNRVVLQADDQNRNLKIGDVDGDAKPDIVFTSIDDTNLGLLASNVSVFRNQQCVFPEILNGAAITVCNGSTERLYSTQEPGATYRWQRDSDPTVDTTDPFFDITAAGSYTVTLISDGGACSITSAPILVSVDAGVIPGGIVVSSNAPVCIDDMLMLTVTGPVGTTYTWRGPNNFSSNLQNPSIPNFTENMVGKYYVTPTLGNCAGPEEFTLVSAIETPSLFISNSGDDQFCQPGNTQLSVLFDANYTYQWKRDGTPISGETTNQYTVTQSGTYTVAVGDITIPGCSVQDTPGYDIAVFSAPVAAFNSGSNLCAQTDISFNNTSTVDNNATVVYTWDFGDGNNSSVANPTHNYSSGGNYNVSLTTEYLGVTCMDQITKSIVVDDPPAVAITSENNLINICQGDSLLLSVAGTYDNILWNNNANTNSIYANQGGNYSVEVTLNGCSNTANFVVNEFALPVVSITPDAATIKLGEGLQLNASGLENYSWLPAVDSLINDITIFNPVVTPFETTTYTVSGQDINGCLGEASITIQVEEGKITDRINPHKLFSPNNDSVDDNWVIDAINNFPSCVVSIFDEKGIKIFENTPYQNTWDGTFKGNPLPQGVYYYVITCGGKDDRKAGAITLIR